MKIRKNIFTAMTLLFAAIAASYTIAMPYRQDDRTRRQQGQQQQKTDKNGNDSILAQPAIEDEDAIPDSLLHPRWKIQRTLPVTISDLDQQPTDLQRPDNLKQEVEYNEIGRASCRERV